MTHQSIAQEDFEFYYLIELTRQRIKPLSRWEKPITRKQNKWLRQTGLKKDAILRFSQNGNRLYETIFSHSSHYLDFYRRRFSGKVLDRSESTQRVEGFLFGYPSCCVNQFIQKPYQANFLEKGKQQKLFHWACPNCRMTPELLLYYLPIHQNTRELYQREFASKKKLDWHLPRRLSVAAALSFLLTAGSLPAQVIPDSSHYIPVTPDLDLDYLSDAEEVYVGSSVFSAYTIPGITDNINWTQFFKVLIDALPTTSQTDRPYRQDFHTWGFETCQKCGANVDMGFVRLINPMQNLHMDIPYLGLHYLEYHSFSFAGSLHNGRVNLDSLKQILFPYQSTHMLSVFGDSDHDGLTDSEEDSLNFDPNNYDTNGDSIPDGAEVAAQLIRLFPQLKDTTDGLHTRITLNLMDGVENCQVCGATHNMGSIEFRNPENGRVSQIHFNGLHALAHGSFAYNGTTWPDQRISAVELYRTMKTHHLFIQDDRDQDGLTDDEETHFGYNPDLPDSDGDGICDGMDLALTMKTVLDSLPTSPGGIGPNVVHHPTYGVWNCLLCGEPVNMGFLEIWHPHINGPFTMSYYAYHFLEKGSFAYEGRIDNGQWQAGRLDPFQLAAYLDFTSGIPIDKKDTAISDFTLHQNYPNPFNSTTKISWQLSRLATGQAVGREVKLKIFNLLGQEVRTLVNERQRAGNHSVVWDGRDDTGKELASGIYLYRLFVGPTVPPAKDFILTGKMVLLK
jgi:hypothetical protein